MNNMPSPPPKPKSQIPLWVWDFDRDCWSCGDFYGNWLYDDAISDFYWSTWPILYERISNQQSSSMGISAQGMYKFPPVELRSRKNNRGKELGWIWDNGYYWWNNWRANWYWDYDDWHWRVYSCNSPSSSGSLISQQGIPPKPPHIPTQQAGCGVGCKCSMGQVSKSSKQNKSLNKKLGGGHHGRRQGHGHGWGSGSGYGSWGSGYGSDCSGFSAKEPEISTFNSARVAPKNFEKYIITFANGVDIDSKIKDYEKNGGFKSKHCLKETIRGCSATINKALVSSLMNDPDVVLLEKDSLMSVQLYNKTTALNVASGPRGVIPPLWNQSITNTIVADSDNYSIVHCYIVDTGVLASHVEFVPGQVLLDYNAITHTNNAVDDNGHGTAVASIIGGKTVGAAAKATIHSIKALDSTGSGYVSDIINGLNWIILNRNPGPCIINMSLGGGFSASLNAAVQTCITSGITVVCAAGNSGVDASSSSPASTVGAITVAAYDSTKTKPSWSNFGPVVTTFAPGVSIKSAYGDSNVSYYLVDGTSFACPMEVGIIARYLKAKPDATQSNITTFVSKSNILKEIINPGTNTPNQRNVWNAANVNVC